MALHAHYTHHASIYTGLCRASSQEFWKGGAEDPLGPLGVQFLRAYRYTGGQSHLYGACTGNLKLRVVHCGS